MASAKQIKARKLFAKRVKRGDFRKSISKTKNREQHNKRATHNYIVSNMGRRLFKDGHKPTRLEFKKAGYTQKEINDYFAKEMK